MTGKSSIEWTEHTWNPIVGCSVLTPGCTNCYAMKMAARIEAMKPSHYDGTTKRVKGNAVWTGKLALAPEHILLEPLRRKKPTTYFVNSMGDLFHEDAPDEWIDQVFAVMALCPQHTFQALTKRAGRMLDYFNETNDRTRYYPVKDAIVDLQESRSVQTYSWQWPLPNVWLGVSTERQEEADQRIPLLLQTPAAVRFISAEPLLGPIDLVQCRAVTRETPDMEPAGRIGWVIVGGESGPGARPMYPGWARSLRDQCAAAAVPFFFKQWGAWRAETAPGTDVDVSRLPRNQAVAFGDGKTNHILYTNVGKKAAGRLLDGKQYDGMPR